MNYQIRNWSEYNAGLKQRGSVTFWLDESAINNWLEASLSGKRGASPTYSDTAIATFETMKCSKRFKVLLQSLLSVMLKHIF